MAVSGIGVTLTAAGASLVYAGIKGVSVLAVVQNLVSGKPVATDVTVPLTYTPPPGGGSFNFPAPNADAPSGLSANQQIGFRAASVYGWQTGANWDALVNLWNRESGWNAHAENPSSGAYGIPQALPYSKMPKLAWPERHGGASDPSTQIEWGLQYIKQRYGSPVAAWAHSQQTGWY